MADSKAKMAAIKARLAIPVMAAPMFLVSGTDSVVAACEAGVIGSLPTLNARTLEILDGWMADISTCLAEAEKANPGRVAPWAANLIAHRSNPRVQEELELILKYKPPIVVVAWAKPGPIVDAIHSYGGLVFADVNTVEYARKSVDAGVDGLILVCAGAGGHTGELSPFAFVPAVREFFDGPLGVGGGIVDGYGVRAVEVLGADFANLGTRFIATSECRVDEEYKRMLVECESRDIITTAFFTGVSANYLVPSIVRSGLDPEEIREGKAAIDVGSGGTKAWKDVWSGGQGVFATKQISTTAEIVAELAEEYHKARELP
ncbi:MAG: nitronate monooxygenase [Porticoccaceae bacterium]